MQYKIVRQPLRRFSALRAVLSGVASLLALGLVVWAMLGFEDTAVFLLALGLLIGTVVLIRGIPVLLGGHWVEIASGRIRIKQGFATREIELSKVKYVTEDAKHGWGWLAVLDSDIPFERHVDMQIELQRASEIRRHDTLAWPKGIKSWRHRLTNAPRSVVHLSPVDREEFVSVLRQQLAEASLNNA